MWSRTPSAREPAYFRTDGADRHGQLVDPPPPQQPLPQPGDIGWGIGPHCVDQLVLPITRRGEVGWKEEGVHGRVRAAAGMAYRRPPGLHGDVQLGDPSTGQPAPAELDHITDHQVSRYPASRRRAETGRPPPSSPPVPILGPAGRERGTTATRSVVWLARGSFSASVACSANAMTGPPRGPVHQQHLG